jgi:hypothetical protein
LSEGKSDWRLTGQEGYLKGATLVRKPYRVYSEKWEHDHCAFCWAKFMDPDYSDAHRKAIENDSELLTEGYATTAEHPHGADYYWICQECFDDFAQDFGWRVVSE